MVITLPREPHLSEDTDWKHVEMLTVCIGKTKLPVLRTLFSISLCTHASMSTCDLPRLICTTRTLLKLTWAKFSGVCTCSCDGCFGHHVGTNIVQSSLKRPWNMLDSQGCAPRLTCSHAIRCHTWCANKFQPVPVTNFEQYT
jgi:hypothetical protein